MTASFSTVEGITTFRLEWKLLSEKMSAKVSDAAEKYFNNGVGNHGTEEEPILFASLGNQDKADVVFEYVTMVLLNDAEDQRLKRHRAIADVNYEAEEAHE